MTIRLDLAESDLRERVRANILELIEFDGRTQYQIALAAFAHLDTTRTAKSQRLSNALKKGWLTAPVASALALELGCDVADFYLARRSPSGHGPAHRPPEPVP